VLHPQRIPFTRRPGVVKSRCPKFSLSQPNEAPVLAGSHRLRQLRGGLAGRLVTGCDCAGCWRVLVRGGRYSSEKRTARFFKRIFRHSIGLFHLGLLISSSFVLRSASSPALLLFLNRGRGGWHAVPGPKCFLFRPAPFHHARPHGSGGITVRGLTAKSALFFNLLRALDLLLFFAAIAVLLSFRPTHKDSAIQRPNVSPPAELRATHPIGLTQSTRLPIRESLPAPALNGSTPVEYFNAPSPRPLQPPKNRKLKFESRKLMV